MDEVVKNFTTTIISNLIVSEVYNISTTTSASSVSGILSSRLNWARNLNTHISYSVIWLASLLNDYAGTVQLFASLVSGVIEVYTITTFIASLATKECSECLTQRCLRCSFAQSAIMCSICPTHKVTQTCRVSSPRLSLLSFKLLHVFRSMETDLILCWARILLIQIHKAHCWFMIWYFPLTVRSLLRMECSVNLTEKHLLLL
jgi:hypothetical protein